MRRSKAPTLEDVAREAGVSTMAVSVVLNGSRSQTRVSDATRARIVEAATRLEYRPNSVARGLSRRRMDTIGIAAQVGGGRSSIYFLEVMNGILEAAADRGQNTTVFSVGEWQGDESRILRFCDPRVDGILFIGPDFAPGFAETIQRLLPIVTIHSNHPIPGVFGIDIDNEGGAYVMVRHLIEQGHRRIAHFSGAPDHRNALLRIAGYRRALEEAGIPFDPALIVPSGVDPTSGRDRMAHLLDNRPLDPLPTAIHCVNDAVAGGCLEVLAQRGIRVPTDISVAGFDDLLTARMTSPQLTTVRQPFPEMGSRAVELLLSQIQPDSALSPDGENTSVSISQPSDGVEIFPATLVVRGSVAPPSTRPLPSPVAG